MAILGINHINIEVSAEELPRMKAFYQDMLGLTPGFRALSKRDGAWLYAGETPVIHLSVTGDPLNKQDKAHFNHVAFACSGVAEFKAELDRKGLQYMLEVRNLADKPMTQIFFHDPVGIKIELNFAGEVLP
jgi:catechol 2,3-dioxygenase-like lactoylglutathione lyase family enzyme